MLNVCLIAYPFIDFSSHFSTRIQQFVLDLTLLFRENLADKASTIHEKAKGVEEQVRPDEQEQESDSPIKDLAQATKDAAGVVLGRDGQDQEASAENGKEGKGKGKEQDPSELDEKDSLWISEASERIGRVSSISSFNSYAKRRLTLKNLTFLLFTSPRFWKRRKHLLLTLQQSKRSSLFLIVMLHSSLPSLTISQSQFQTNLSLERIKSSQQQLKQSMEPSQKSH